MGSLILIYLEIFPYIQTFFFDQSREDLLFLYIGFLGKVNFTEYLMAVIWSKNHLNF